MYKIKTSERNNDKATEFETKALLYLLTKVKGNKHVDLFIIDCFNDLTGVTNDYRESWDVQSKGVASLTPRKIGIALYTLFSNYVSDIDFSHYIIFLPPINNKYLYDFSATTFGIANFNETKIIKIKQGLHEEIVRRKDSDINTAPKLLLLDQFLESVTFVIDHFNKADYIRSIIEFKNIDRLDDDFLNCIFDEIRNQQATKKIRNVFGEELVTIQDAEKFNKTIYRKDIELLVVNRVIGNDLFASKGIPLYFVGEVRDMDEEDVIDLIQDSQSKISKTLFNKNNKKSFWHLLESIMILLIKNPKSNIHIVYDLIDNNLKKSVFTLDEISLLYLIALVKEGLNNENS